MSHPRTVDKFIPWSKAMVAGATVDKPNYGKGSRMKTHSKKPKRRKRRKRRMHRAKKEG